MYQSNVKIFQPDPKKKLNKKKVALKTRLANHFIFCFSVISIGGLKFIIEKNISVIERLIWIVCVVASAVFAWIICYNSWTRYQTRPVVITLERDFYNWNFTVPTATVCLQQQMPDDSEGVEALLNYLNVSEDRRETAKAFFLNLYNGDLNTYEDLEYIEEFADGDKYLEWLVRFGDKMTDTEVSQTFGETADIKIVIGELGLCYTYNSEVAAYSSPKYWARNTMELVKTKKISKTYFDPSVGIVTVYVKNVPDSYDIYFHGSNEIAGLDSKGAKAALSTLTEVSLGSTSVWTTPEVEKLSIPQRNCRLTHESNLDHSPVYSYNLCRVECRIKEAFKRCHCVPFYYRHLENEPVCGIRGMQCLGKHKDIITTLRKGEKHICNCKQNCNNEAFVIFSFDTTEWFLGTHIQWQLANFPEVRYKRDLIFSGTDLLVQIGGTAGLFLGCSILSVIEIVYFLTIRLIVVLNGN